MPVLTLSAGQTITEPPLGVWNAVGQSTFVPKGDEKGLLVSLWQNLKITDAYSRLPYHRIR